MRARRPRYRSAPLLDLTPMVDVVFLLIIFFMVSTTFITLESGLPVDLPQAQSAQQQQSQLPTVTINREETIVVAGSELSLDQLVPTLQQILAERGNEIVILRADQSVSHGFTVQVMDAIKRAGAQRVAIATGG